MKTNCLKPILIISILIRIILSIWIIKFSYKLLISEFIKFEIHSYIDHEKDIIHNINQKNISLKKKLVCVRACVRAYVRWFVSVFNAFKLLYLNKNVVWLKLLGNRQSIIHCIWSSILFSRNEVHLVKAKNTCILLY